MTDDMKKNCHQIVGETDSEYGMRKARWQQSIERKFMQLLLEYDAAQESSKTKPAEFASK